MFTGRNEMLKLIGSACALAILLFAAKPRDDRFSRYKPVEAFEVRPGILVMPTYSSDGQICQAVIQKEHYSDGVIHLDSTMPRDVVDRVVNEIVPDSEKGPLAEDKEFARLSLYGGHVITSFVEYKNVSIDVSRNQGDKDEVVALIRWKYPSCKRDDH
jgi:hypothetical protein